MADSYNKKERDKKRRKKKQDKAERKKQRKEQGVKPVEFMYLDEFGNLTSEKPDPNAKKSEVKLEDINISTPSFREEEELEKKGVVKFFDNEKRFGFINEKGTSIDYFVHEDNLIDQIKERDFVFFKLGDGPKGKVAIEVKLDKK